MADAAFMCVHTRVLVNVHARCYKWLAVLARAYVYCGLVLVFMQVCE